jgi:circadian clock protein KaiB
LFIAGDGPNSTAAVANLRGLLAQRSAAHVEVEIIDVFMDPQRGVSAGVFVTPMLVRVKPTPERRILGNLSDRAILLSVLMLEEREHE